MLYEVITDEVLDYTTRPTPGPGQVVESNSTMLVSMARAEGVITSYSIHYTKLYDRGGVGHGQPAPVQTRLRRTAQCSYNFV